MSANLPMEKIECAQCGANVRVAFTSWLVCMHSHCGKMVRVCQDCSCGAPPGSCAKGRCPKHSASGKWEKME